MDNIFSEGGDRGVWYSVNKVHYKDWMLSIVKPYLLDNKYLLNPTDIQEFWCVLQVHTVT